MTLENAASILDDIAAEVAWRRADSIVRETSNWFQVITPSSKIVPLNGVYRSILVSEEADASIEKAIEEFDDHRTPFRWIVTNSSRPMDIESRLEKFHFKKDHDALGLAVEASQIVGSFDQKLVVIDLVNEHLDEWIDAAMSGWGNPDSYRASLREDILRSLQEQRDVLRHFSAFIGSEIVGTGTLRFCSKSAHLLGSCVKPKFRGRGVYRALVGKRAEVAMRSGFNLITTHGKIDSSAPVLKKMGFLELSRATQYSHA